MSIVPCKRAKEGGKFDCAQAGCSQCLERLIGANEGLIHACLRQQKRGGVLYADLVQEGRIALWQAVLHYDCRRGTAFSTYAWITIRNQLWAAVGKVRDEDRWEEEEDWVSVVRRAENAQVAAGIQASLIAAVEQLPEQLRAVIVWVYGLESFPRTIGDSQPPRSMAALGRKWDLTRERIRQLRNEALVLLRLPVYSAELREWCDQDSRTAYRQAQQLNHNWLARRRQS